MIPAGCSKLRLTLNINGATGTKASSLPRLNVLLHSKESFLVGTSPATLPASWLCPEKSESAPALHVIRVQLLHHTSAVAMWKLSVDIGQYLVAADALFFWLRNQPCYSICSYSAFPLPVLDQGRSVLALPAALLRGSWVSESWLVWDYGLRVISHWNLVGG